MLPLLTARTTATPARTTLLRLARGSVGRPLSRPTAPSFPPTALVLPSRRPLCSTSVRWRSDPPPPTSRPPTAATSAPPSATAVGAAAASSSSPATNASAPISPPASRPAPKAETLLGEPVASSSSAADEPKSLTSGPAAELKQAFEENPYTWPNLLTLSRMLACPVLAYAIVHDQSALAGGLLVYAGVTDYVDGWMARHWNMGSVLGSMLDPLADKTLMATLVGALAYKAILPMPLAIVIVGRDVALALGAFYLRFRTLPPPRTFSRYWDISRPSISIHPTTFSKINTALQIVLMTALTVSPLLPAAAAPWLEAGMWLVGATTAGSGLSYLWVKGAIRRVPMK